MSLESKVCCGAFPFGTTFCIIGFTEFAEIHHDK